MKYFTSWLQTIVQLFLSSIMPIMKNAVKMIIRVKSVEQGWLDFFGGNFRNTFFQRKREIFLNTSESKQKCVSCARNGTLKLRTRRIPFHLFFPFCLTFMQNGGNYHERKTEKPSFFFSEFSVVQGAEYWKSGWSLALEKNRLSSY